MLSQYFKPIFERQKARFPEYIQQLETLANDPDPRKTEFLQLAAIISHGLRNDLTVIAVILELESMAANQVRHGG